MLKRAKKTFYKIGPAEITGVMTKNNVLDLRVSFLEKLEPAKNELNIKKYKSLLNYYIRINNRGKLINFDD